MDSPSPLPCTFCDSLFDQHDACSSHGFSSLQSPSAFPSFSSSSSDSSQQNEAVAEQCPSLFHRSSKLEACCVEKQDAFLCRSSLSDNWAASHEDILQDGTLLDDSIAISTQLPDTEISPLPFTFCETSGSCLLHLSPDLTQSSLFPLTCDGNEVCSEDGYGLQSQTPIDYEYGSPDAHIEINQTHNFDTHQAQGTHVQINEDGYGFLTQLSNDCQSGLPDKHVEVDETGQLDPHDAYGDHFNMSKVSRLYVLTSSNHYFQGMHHSESRGQRIQAMNMPTPPSSLRSECGKKTKQEAINKAMASPMSAASRTVKENLPPLSFKVGREDGSKIESTGWMCPRDAKKSFKPKPMQVLLDKWLIKQR